MVAISASAAGVTAFVDERRQLGVVRPPLLRQRMTGGHRRVSGAQKNYPDESGWYRRSGCCRNLHIEGDFPRLQAANPVALHRFTVSGQWSAYPESRNSSSA